MILPNDDAVYEATTASLEARQSADDIGIKIHSRTHFLEHILAKQITLSQPKIRHAKLF